MVVLGRAGPWHQFARAILNHGPPSLDAIGGVRGVADINALRHGDVRLFEGAGARKQDGAGRGVLAGQGHVGDYERVIRERYGDLADEFLRLYPSSNMDESILAASRDALYGWTSERLVRSQTAAGQPSFLYLFDHGYPAADSAGLHAFHASEIPYMFGNLQRTPPRWPAIPDAQVELGLSDEMVAYWVSFVRDGQP